MSNKNKYDKFQKGNCLCGSVQIFAEEVKTKVGVCHCSICRKWSGGSLLAVDAVGKVVFKDEKNIVRYNSSDWAERGFCKKCGTHLFYHLTGNDQYIIPVGLLDESKNFVLEHQIFIEEKPDYYSFSQKTKNMTGAEVFAEFGAE